MSTTVLDVSVVICTYTLERWTLLRAAIESVRMQTPGPAEILVVVDHNDRLADRARTIPGVKVVESTGEPGLSGARNTGVGAATGRIIAFLDDDATAGDGWLDELCRPLLTGEADVTGGTVEAVFVTGRPIWFPPEFDWVVGCTYTGWPTAPAPIRNPIGCSMAFTADALATAGEFQSGLGRSGGDAGGCEETELCIRLRQRWSGVRIQSAPTSRARQAVPAARSTPGYFVSRCAAEGRSKARVARRVGRSAALAAETGFVASTLPRAVASAIVEAVRTRRGAPLGRAVAILAGLAAASWGYALEVARHVGRRS